MAPILSQIEWTSGDLTKQLDITIEALFNDATENLQKWRQLDPETESTVLLIDGYWSLKIRVLASSLASPGDIYDLYSRSMAALQSSVLGQFLYLISVFNAIGGKGLILPEAPRYLLADIWSSFHGDCDKKTEFIANYHEFVEDSKLLSNWRAVYDDGLSRMIHSNPDLINSRTIQFRNLSPRAIWVRLRLVTILGDLRGKINDLFKGPGPGRTRSLLEDLYLNCRSAISFDAKVAKAKFDVHDASSGPTWLH
jgi:hypothetical protein